MDFKRAYNLFRDMFKNLKLKKGKILVPVIIDNDPSGNPDLYFFEILDCNPTYITKHLLRVNQLRVNVRAYTLPYRSRYEDVNAMPL
jgi:hypothetical protein